MVRLACDNCFFLKPPSVICSPLGLWDPKAANNQETAKQEPSTNDRTACWSVVENQVPAIGPAGHPVIPFTRRWLEVIVTTKGLWRLRSSNKSRLPT